MSYLIPAPYSGMSTWYKHTRRVPPSSEPGTDYYMPIGTPLRAPADCRVVQVGGGLAPATGRFVTVDDGTRWLRFLHLKRQDVEYGDTLKAGEVFGLSGASGYGSEFFGASRVDDPAMIARTGGPHVHVTAFKGRAYTFGSTGTVDFHALTGGAVAGGGSAAGGDDMSVDDVYNARDNEGRNMLDLGREIRNDLARITSALASRIDGVPAATLAKPVPVEGRLKGRETNLAAFLANNDEHVLVTLDAISSIAGGGTIDVNALAAKLREALAPDLVKALGNALVNG